MKKLYIITSFLLVSALAFSQFSENLIPEPTEISKRTLKSHLNFDPNGTKATPFWSEDFSGGIPATWTNGSTPTPPVISAPWVYRGPSTTPNISTGSQGAYAGTNGPIQSPTASNGFVIFDSDYYDNGGTAGNFGAGPYPCNDILGGTPTGHVGTLTTDSIDCSMYSDITMVFNSFYREYTGIAKVAFSIDGGITFTDTVEVHPDIEVNERTDSDYQVLVRFPQNIAGNSNVKIQFIYDGTVLYSTYNGYYFWMIDDIELIETPDHLLDLSSETYGGWWVGYQSTGDLGIDYTFNPLNQAVANPYRFEAVVANNGAASQTNVTLHIDISDISGNPVWNTTSNPMTLNVMSNDTLTTPTFTPTITGYHQVNYWVTSDSFPTTDTIGRGTVVTDTVYGVDFDWDSDGANAGGGYYLGRSCGGQVLGNALDMYVDDEVSSISFHVEDQSVAGADVFVALYEIDPMVTPYSPVYLGQSDDYTLTQSDIGSWVTIGFDDPLGVYAGTTYIAAVGGYANPVDTSLISSSSNDNTLSFVQDNGCDIGSGGFGYWYSISSPLLIRMNLGEPAPPTSIDLEMFDGTLSIYPNPSKGIFNLDLLNVKDGEYTITVDNLLGQEVYSEIRNVINSSSKTLDLSNLTKGVYMVNINNSETSIDRKIIIE